MILLLDITSLDGRSIQEAMIWGQRPRLHSRMRFPPEFPTKKDWQTWAKTWLSMTGNGLTLTHPLGKWLRPPHFKWPWKYDNDLQELYILSTEDYIVYRQPATSWLTRSLRLHHRTTNHMQSATGRYITVKCIISPTGLAYPKPSLDAADRGIRDADGTGFLGSDT